MGVALEKIQSIIGENFHYKKALFAVSSLGLGHATRTLPIIQYYAKIGFEIDIISFGNALTFLHQELEEFKHQIHFISMQDYPPLERGQGFAMYLYLLKDSAKTQKIIFEERRFIKSSKKHYDFIFSDGRYGIYHKKIPSYIFSHQIAFIPPKGLDFLQKQIDLYNKTFFQKFTKLLIPDYKDMKKSLAGKLSHSELLGEIQHEYIGPISSYEKQENISEDIDFLCIISGYLLFQKQNFITKLIEESKKLPGKKVFILGNPGSLEKQELPEFNMTLHQSVTPKMRQELFNRAKCIISRTGYTSVMDIVCLGKKAILFPTINQTEQEYLGEFLSGKYGIICGDEKKFNLLELSKKL